MARRTIPIGAFWRHVMKLGRFQVSAADLESLAVTVPYLISGTGSVSQIGTGTTILTANNTYTGTTTITAGTLQLGKGARPAASPTT